ncbi:hypothetical protein ALC62_00888 [Cyphomyrmex costatus]|uniref:Uncharacterized protein n=1 Tax=Cyphomyrmex costatus TaxID=456900 RepID=A0A195D580_9HYME|nr:hypothetical protein ALC62_00888 [Cyphomyrmex costatus]
MKSEEETVGQHEVLGRICRKECSETRRQGGLRDSGAAFSKSEWIIRASFIARSFLKYGEARALGIVSTAETIKLELRKDGNLVELRLKLIYVSRNGRKFNSNNSTLFFRLKGDASIDLDNLRIFHKLTLSVLMVFPLERESHLSHLKENLMRRLIMKLPNVGNYNVKRTKPVGYLTLFCPRTRWSRLREKGITWEKKSCQGLCISDEVHLKDSRFPSLWIFAKQIPFHCYHYASGIYKHT